MTDFPYQRMEVSVGWRVDRFIRFVLQHWLALLLTVMLIFVVVPFLAPVAMVLGWTPFSELIYAAYGPFCHQFPQRSWFFFGEKLTYSMAEIEQVYQFDGAWQLRTFTGTPEMGWKVAWSDRMISFYAMTPVFGLLYALLRRWRGQVKPIGWALFFVLLLPLVLDGKTHLINDTIYGVPNNGFRNTNEWLAVLTGYRWPEFYAGDHFGTFNWWVRLVTGFPAAWGMAFLIFPWLDQIVQEMIDTY
ncbi:DUF2085 domain-containing protein [Chloroflexi bacterium TSY]|nr:DUF2085 domain-containing protein [Chloroflexi bacterium TSY]